MNGEILRGEVYWLKDRDSVGSEECLRRPVAIVSSDRGNATSPAVVGASMTTKSRWGVINVPVESNGKRSWVMCNQLRCIDRSRLDGYICTLTDREMAEVDRGLLVALGLNDVTVDEDEVSLLEEEVATLKSENARLKASLDAKGDKSTIENDTYKRLYERAIEELVALKFERDLDKATQEKKTVVEPVVEDVVEEQESEPELLDINSCTFDELRSVGVDALLAHNVINNRPYESVEDLKFVPGMKKVGFAILKNKIRVVPKEKAKPVVKPEVETPAKLNINTATVAEMMEKVGMVKQLASAIRSYRDKNGKFEKIEDLLKIPRFGTGCMEKYGPKLEV